MYGARELNGIELTGGINKSAQPDQLEITRHYTQLLTHATFYASLNTLVQLWFVLFLVFNINNIFCAGKFESDSF